MPLFSLPLRVQEFILVAKPVSEVFGVVQDLKTWDIWSPWMLMDPDGASTVMGEGDKIGDEMLWDTDLLGAGSMTHAEFIENNKIVQELSFIKPFKSTARVVWDFEPISAMETKITWSMDSRWPVFLFFMRNKMQAFVGKDYQRGLLRLKAFVETGAVPVRIEFGGIVESAAQPYVGITRTESIADMTANMGDVFQGLLDEVSARSISIEGNPFSFYHKMDFVTQTVKYTCCVPVSVIDQFETDLIVPGVRPAGNVFGIKHMGSYEYLGDSWTAAMNFVLKNKIMNPKNSPWEEYLNSPFDTAPENLETRVFVPVKS